MAPTLRSSPAGTRSTRNSTKTPVSTPDSKSSTPSKPRYCTTCKRPRKGHPREGCPFAEDVEEDGEQNETLSDSPTRNVADALDALNLEAVYGDTENEEESPKKERKPFTRMPGTLVTPTSSFMYSSQGSSSTKDESEPPYLGLSQLTEYDDAAGAVTPRRVSTPIDDGAKRATRTRPLVRTLTSEERLSFTSALTHLAKATVYVLPTPDVPTICASAATHGLFTRTLPLDHADMLVVVGPTEVAVEVLLYQVEAKMHALVPAPAGKTQTLSTAAKAAVFGAVGAVAAWSALAFS